MRLKLTIERDSLPRIRTIWPLTATQQSWTIAQLLQHISQTFPLDDGRCGLEDYLVTLAGFECIHHHEIASVCKDEDELVIRPLQTAEVRARAAGGRQQISENGRHLIDGVPFGKAALAGMIQGGPRKRIKLDHEGDLGKALLLEGRAEDEDIDDESEEEDDSDFRSDDASDSNDEDEEEDDNDAMELADSDGEEADKQTSDSEDTDSSSSSDSDNDSEVSWDGLPTSTSSQKGSGPGRSAEQLNNQLPKASQLGAEVETTAAKPRGAPFQGTDITRERNRRRRLKQRLDWLKKQGKLPAEASFADLATYDGTASPVSKDGAADLARQQQMLLAAIASGGIDVNDGSLLSAPAPQHDNDEPPEQMSSKQPVVAMSSDEPSIIEPPVAVAVVPTALIPASVQRRAKLDLAGSKRLLFGSLGVKVPKSDADKASTRTKLANGNVNAEPATIVTTKEKLQPVEDWQSKINLSAIECVDEDVALSAPPFPFVQRWDPQYRCHRNKKRKRQAVYTETYDKYNTSGGGDFLDYDGVNGQDGFDDSYWEEGALLDDQAWEKRDDGAVDDGFPALPTDLTACAELTEADAKPGDFVVWSAMDCSAATGWKPTFVTKSVKLIDRTDEGWTVQVAQRDLPAKMYDKKGQRIFKKFEMNEDTEDDSTERVMVWEEFGGAARLLSRSA